MPDGGLYIVGMSEKNGTPAHGLLGGGLRAVLPCPRIHIAEEHFVSFENILIREPLDQGQSLECVINSLDKRAMLEMANDAGVFFAEQITEITTRLKIAEGIKRHGWASRRYQT
jgi:hypothetical protein